MTAEERIDQLEERLARMEEMLTRALSGAGNGDKPKPAPVPKVRHTYKQEMENLRKAMELSRLLHTAPRAVFRAAQKKFFADGGWTPPAGLIDATQGGKG